jgi:predicted molibdopterin-dependent oxidoreductase YjgC
MLYQYQTGPMTMKMQGFNESAPKRFVDISRKDADNIGISEGETLRVSSGRGEGQVKATISRKAVADIVFIPFHCSEGAVNILMNRNWTLSQSHLNSRCAQ